MPFTTAVVESRAYALARRVQDGVLIAYSIPICAVGLAYSILLLSGEFFNVLTPLAPFYAAILISTFAGPGPGIFALARSSLLVANFFIPAPPPPAVQVTPFSALLFFLVANAVNIVSVSLFRWALRQGLEREKELRDLIEGAPTGIIVVDESGKVRLANASAGRLFGFSIAELVGTGIELLLPEWIGPAQQKLQGMRLVSPLPDIRPSRDLIGCRKDGTDVPVAVSLNEVNRGNRHFVIVTILDVTERKRLAESQGLLLREIHHRTQNLFAVVQSIVNRSLAGDRLKEPRTTLLNRLHALARTNTIFADTNWESVPLGQMVLSELEPWCDRVAVTGCELLLSPSAAQSFALIVHELATNATKYGALSNLLGTVEVQGRIESVEGRDSFAFRWVENGGPVVRVPTRKGFGSSVLIDAVKAFGAEVNIDYAAEGLRYEAVMPLTLVRAVEPAPAIWPRPSGTADEIRT